MLREIWIGAHLINDASPAFVVAEIGTNHGGDLERAKQLITAAAECGCDAVKLQKRDNKNIFTSEIYNQPYNSENSYGLTYGEHREALEFGLMEYVALRQYAQKIGILLFASVFDVASAGVLDTSDNPAFKIASGDLTNIPLIRYVAGLHRPVIVSTGGGTIADVQRVYDEVPHDHLVLLQCTSSYPVEPAEMNLRVIETYRNMFPDVVIGLSDHYDGIAMAGVAYTLGARVFEKHFTLNHTWKGTDQVFSLEPEGMKRMVRDLNRTRDALGTGKKQRYLSEDRPLYKMAKSLVAARSLPKGHLLTADDIAIKSPGGGLPPYLLDGFIGAYLFHDLAQDALLDQNDVYHVDEGD